MTIDLAKLRAETLALIHGTIPGPWFLSDAGAIVRAPDGENDPWLVAEICGCCGYGTDTSDANARLIAAAPTLAADTLRLLDEIERLRAALEPFASYMGDGGDLDYKGAPVPDDQGVGWVYLTHGDFRRARATLKETRHD